MKKTILCLFCIVNSFFLFSDNSSGYTIIGTLPDSINNTYIYLSRVSSINEINKIDSTLIQNGRFTFKGIADTTKYLYGIWTEDRFLSGWVVLEPGTIICSYQDDTPNGYAVTKGTSLNNLITDSIFIPAKQLEKIVIRHMEFFKNGHIDREAPEIVELETELKMYGKIMTKNLLLLIKENYNNPLGEYFFLSFSQVMKEKELNEIIPNLSENVQEKYYELKNAKNTRKELTGQQYLPFSLKTLNNENFILSDAVASNKLILLDFWASWCMPCIKEMPMLVQLYKDYKDKGLEIVGISLDEGELSWKKTVEKNKMTWVQTINNKEKSANVANMYNVTSIPHTILIDANGKIVGDGLRGEDLIEEIKNILNK